MKIADIIKLLAAGYKKAEIDSLIAAEKEEAEAEAKRKEEESNDRFREQNRSSKSLKPETTETEEEPDFKALYESLKADNEKLQRNLTELQQMEVHRDNSGKENEVTFESVQNIFR